MSLEVLFVSSEDVPASVEPLSVVPVTAPTTAAVPATAAAVTFDESLVPPAALTGVDVFCVASASA